MLSDRFDICVKEFFNKEDKKILLKDIFTFIKLL